MIVAFYFSLLVLWQEFPLVVGPYDNWDECNYARMYFDRRGYMTDSCGLMPYPQDSVGVEWQL